MDKYRHCKSYDFDELVQREWVQNCINRLKAKGDETGMDPVHMACMMYIIRQNAYCSVEEIKRANPWLKVL